MIEAPISYKLDERVFSIHESSNSVERKTHVIEYVQLG